MELDKENQSVDFSCEQDEAATLKSVMETLQEAKQKLTEVMLQESSAMDSS